MQVSQMKTKVEFAVYVDGLRQSGWKTKEKAEAKVAQLKSKSYFATKKIEVKQEVVKYATLSLL